MATRVIAAQDKTSSGAGDDVQIKAGNANTSGAGGSIILQPGSQVTTGGDGFVQIKGTGSSTILKLTESAYNRSFTWTQDYAGASLSADGGLGGVTIFNKFFVSNYFSNIRAAYNSYVGLGNSNDQNYDNWGFIYLRNDGVVNWWGNAGLTYGSVGTIRVSNASTGGGSLAYTSSTPTALSTNPTNDLVLTGSAFQRLSSSSALSVTGIAPPATGAHVDGRLIWLYNVGSFNITLKHSQTSTAANQFINEGSGDIVLGPGRMVQAIYDSTSSKWRVNGETYPYVFPTADGTNGQVLTTNGSGTLSWTTVSAGASASGTTNYISKFTGTSTLGNSIIFDNGTNVGIGTATPSNNLSIGASAGKIGFQRGSGDGEYCTIGFKSTTGNDRYVFEINNSSGTGELRLNQGGTSTPIGMTFYTNNAEKMRIDSSGNVGIGTSSPQSTLDTRGLTILTNSAGANYNENLRLPESSTGYASIHMGGPIATSGTGANQWSIIKAAAALSHRFEIRHNTSQFFTITTAGDVGVNTTSPGAKLQVDTGATGTKGQIIKAFLGQSANLSEWQGSTGTVLASIDSAGRMTLAAGAAASNADLYFNNSASVNPAIKWNNVSAQTGLRFYSGSNLIAAIQENGAIRSTSFQTWGGVYLSDFSVQRSGSASISFGASASEAGVEISNGSNSTLGIASRISTTYSGTKGLVVKGVASQTANLTEWQNSSGTVLASVSYDGQLNLGTATSGSKQLTIARNGGNPGILIYKSPDGSLNSSQLVAGIGTGSSSSNTGTSGGSEYGIINVYHNGTERARLYAYDVGTGQTANFALDPFAFGANTSLAQVYVTPKTNAIPGIIVRGKASQTANLTEWQDSTGTVVAAVSPTGAFTGSSFTPYGTFNSTTTIFGNNYWTPNLSGVSNPSTGTFTKTSATADWQSQVYSSEGYTKNVYCAARASQTNGHIIFGLNSDPTTNASYQSIDYSWYCIGDGGGLQIYEDGASVGSFGSYTTSTVLSITYDGENVRYWKDGVLQRTVARSTGNPLYFDTSFYSTGASLNSVQFGPIGQPFGISGTAGYHPKFTSQQTLGNSIVYDNGTNVGIGTTSTTGKLTIANNGNQLTLKAYDGSQNNTVSFQAIRANYSDAASVLAIYTNSGSSENERVRIMHTGEMGIGTQSPGGMLDVQQSNSGDMLVRAWNTSTAGTGKSIIRVANSGNNAQGQQIQFSDNNYYTGTISSDRTNGLAFYVGQMASPLASERMRIDTSGNVGIGTASPNMALHVVGAKAGDANEGQGQINVESTAAYNATNGTAFSTSGAGGSVVFRGKYTSGGAVTGFAGIAGSKENTTDGHYGGNLRFYTRSHGANDPPERMRIDSSGNVAVSAGARIGAGTGYINAGATAAGYLELYNSTSGATTLMNTGAFNVLVGTNNTERIRVTSSGLVGIGTSTIAGNNPLADLHVNDASGYGSLQLSQSPYGATIDTGGEIQFAATYRSANDLTQVARIRGLRENATNNNWAGYLAFYTSTGSDNPSASTERMRINSSGNVGIGTTSPVGKLAVDGDIWVYAPIANGYGRKLRFGWDTAQPYIEHSGNGNISINGNVIVGGNANNIYISNKLDHSSAVGHVFDTSNSLATAGAKLMSVRNAASEKAFIDKDGVAYFASAVGINNTSPGAKLQVDTGATGTKGQIIKAFLGQTANPLEIQSSTGLAYISTVPYSNGFKLRLTESTNTNSAYYSDIWTDTGPALNFSSVGQAFRFTGTSTLTINTNSSNVGFYTAGGYGLDWDMAGTYVLRVGRDVSGGSPVVFRAKASQTANIQEWQNSGGTALAYMDANGNFAAVTKSFLIPHPTPAKAAEGKKLRYASLEGPENGVYFRGRLEGENVIILPDYWVDLVDPDSITVNLTARKFAQPSLFVVDANAERVVIESDRQVCCDFIVYATRKDIAKLEVEPDGN